MRLAPVDAELRSRIAWLIQLRWVAVVGALIAITVADILLPEVLPVVELVGVTAFIGLYNVFFYIYAHYLRTQADTPAQLTRTVRFVHVQLVLDYVCLTLLLHFSGGVETPFWSFYILYIIVAGILQKRSATYLYAGFATLLYCGMVLLEYAGIIPHVHLTGFTAAGLFRQGSFVLATLMTFVTTLFTATLMATTIMARLRERSRDLIQAHQQARSRAQELTQLNQRLRELDRDRKHFVQLVTHELRAPVAAIESYANLILDGYVPPERHMEILGRVRLRAAEQLEQINDLLVLAQSQRPPMDTQAISLSESLNEVLDLLRGPMTQKNISLAVQVDPDTPHVMANPDQIKHLWMNLVSNAVKYTPANGNIEISLTHRPASVVGSVRDTGIGISPEEQKRIFDEFYRTNQAKQIEQHGTGLGLAIVKQIVETSGGRVWVNSAPGKGAKFSFSLPRETGQVNTGPSPEEPEDEEPPPSPDQPLPDSYPLS
jgi:signal transduction histidine kinase